MHFLRQYFQVVPLLLQDVCPLHLFLPYVQTRRKFSLVCRTHNCPFARCYQIRERQKKQGETLYSISRDYRVSIAQLLAANPFITNVNMIQAGWNIVIPGLPDPATIPYRIVISKASRTLQLFRNNILVKTYPIAVGKMLTQTPVGTFVVVNRQPNPGGPFGAMWLSLSKAGYGIHGTNDPSSIGKSVSLGCVRMYNQDVLELSTQVPNGTSVIIR